MTRASGLVRAVALTAVVLLSSAGTHPRGAPGPVPADIAADLDAYARGAFDAALEGIRRTPPDRVKTLGQPLVQAAQAWVDRVPEGRAARALAAAAFVLEAQIVRAELGGWTTTDSEPPCAGACVLEWACSLLQSRGEPDAAERVWLLASVALAGGVRDWAFLQAPLSPPGPRTLVRGHALHALARFPDEPRFRMASAVAIASRLAVLPEMETPRAGERTGPAPTVEVLAIGRGNAVVTDMRASQLVYARNTLAALLADPALRPEARLRLGYLDLWAGEYDAALTRTRAVAETATDPDLKYIASYLAAQAAQAIGELGAAEALYQSALDARPHSQSATLGLAALRFQRGDAESAYGLIEASFRERQADDDPWRLFLYGDFARLPGFVRELRRQIGGAR